MSATPGVRARPSFGRALSIRGLDMFDTPPIALGPLFAHEPLIAGATSISEPFCGRGNLVTAMRARGLVVHASDIFPRGCPNSTALDFFDMAERPCDTLISNPPYAQVTPSLEYAWRLGFHVVAFLCVTSFLHTGDRFERIHKRGHLIRVYPLAERLQGMHAAAHTGKKASQPQVHSWFVFELDAFRPGDDHSRLASPPERADAVGRAARASAPRPGFAGLTAYAS